MTRWPSCSRPSTPSSGNGTPGSVPAPRITPARPTWRRRGATAALPSPGRAPPPSGKNSASSRHSAIPAPSRRQGRSPGPFVKHGIARWTPCARPRIARRWLKRPSAGRRFTPAGERRSSGQGGKLMFDQSQRLRDSQHLFLLLTHYARLAAADREAWQDRLMQLPGVQPKDLVRLHGELLAQHWIEQNTGITPLLRAGSVPCCYRVTPAGQRALGGVSGDEC